MEQFFFNIIRGRSWAWCFVGVLICCFKGHRAPELVWHRPQHHLHEHTWMPRTSNNRILGCILPRWVDLKIRHSHQLPIDCQHLPPTQHGSWSRSLEPRISICTKKKPIIAFETPTRFTKNYQAESQKQFYAIETLHGREDAPTFTKQLTWTKIIYLKY